MSIVRKGEPVKFQCSTSLEDGTSLDEPGENDIFNLKAGIPTKENFRNAISNALLGMRVQQTKHIKIPPKLAFGEIDPDKIYKLHASDPSAYEIGDDIQVKVTQDRRDTIVDGIIKSISGNELTVDANHHLAGKTILAKIRIISIG